MTIGESLVKEYHGKDGLNLQDRCLLPNSGRPRARRSKAEDVDRLPHLGNSGDLVNFEISMKLMFVSVCMRILIKNQIVSKNFKYLTALFLSPLAKVAS